MLGRSDAHLPSLRPRVRDAGHDQHALSVLPDGRHHLACPGAGEGPEREPAATSERPGTVPRSSSWWPPSALVVAVAGVGLTVGGVVVIARAFRHPEPVERLASLALGTAVTGVGVGFLVWAVVRLR
jgi:hypothetical protein